MPRGVPGAGRAVQFLPWGTVKDGWCDLKESMGWAGWGTSLDVGEVGGPCMRDHIKIHVQTPPGPLCQRGGPHGLRLASRWERSWSHLGHAGS